MLLHTLVGLQSGFTVVACGIILYMLRNGTGADRRRKPKYVRWWLMSYLLLVISSGIVLDMYREIDWFWFIFAMKAAAYILGDLALVFSIRRILRDHDMALKK